MSIRSLPTELQKLLVRPDQEFTYAHLIKFEKPETTGTLDKISFIATDYVYITDGPYNITYDTNTYIS